MLDESINIYHLFYSFFLSMPRILVVLSVLPFLTETVIPGALKNVFSASLSLAIFPFIYYGYDFSNITVVYVIFLGVKEALIGLVIGFIISIPFWAISASGFLIDMQRGAFSSSLFSPTFSDPVSPIGILLLQSAIVLLFSSGGFLLILEVVYISFLYIPVDSFFNENFFDKDFFIDQSLRMFKIAFILASPVVIIMFCVDLALGICNRFVPQLNVFFISMPIKSLLAVFILGIFLSYLFNAFSKELLDTFISTKNHLKL